MRDRSKLFITRPVDRARPFGMSGGVSGSVLAIATVLTIAPTAAQNTLPQSAPAASGPLGADASAAGTTPTTGAAPDTLAASSAADIVVTASRRAQAISRVPISVAAYTPETLDRRSIRSINDLATLTTGVNFVQNSPVRGFNIAIRGIDSRVGAGTVGIYVDDTPIQVRRLGQFASTIYPQIFDLERVEVLRGPQGTLFGAGSQGGTVRFITPQPDLDKLAVYGRAEVATTEKGSESYEGGIAVGVPLIEDVLAFRGSVYYRRDGGWVDRVDPDTDRRLEKDTNRVSTRAFRGALTWKPAEGVTITPSIYYQRRFINNSNQFWNVRAATPGQVKVPQPSATFTRSFSDPDSGDFVSGDPNAQPGTERFVLASLRAEAEIGGVTVIANTSYYDSKAAFTFDFSTADPAVISRGAISRVPGYTGFNVQLEDQKNYTAEIRFQPTVAGEHWNWLVGAFYAHQRQNSDGRISGANYDFLFQALIGNPNITSAMALGGPLFQPGSYSLVSVSGSLDEQIAAFGELSYNLTPELKLTAGARVSKTKLDFESLRDGPLGGARAIDVVNTKSTPFTPKFNAAYQLDRNNLFYATAAKGFRVGGGNAQLPGFLCGADLAASGLSRAPESYKPDTLWSYEVGAKNKVIDNRVQIDASIFRIDWKNLQQQVFLPCQFFYVANAGKARSRGFDLQISAQPTDRMFLSVAVGYVNAKYTETVVPGTVARTGPRSVIVSAGDVIDNPPWTFNLNARYTLPIGGNEGYIQGDYTHRSQNKRQSPVQDPLSIAFEGYPTIEATNAINLRAGVRIDRFDVSAFVNNLTNDFPLVYYRQDSPGTQLFKNGSVRPRTIGLTLSYR